MQDDKMQVDGMAQVVKLSLSSSFSCVKRARKAHGRRMRDLLGAQHPQQRRIVCQMSLSLSPPVSRL